MLFNSVAFLIFLPLTWAVYWLLGKPRPQNPFLLAASLLFYGWWDWRFLGLLLFTIAVDFWAGRAMGRSTAPRTRRAILLLSLGTNLGVLGFFKYFDFFAASLTEFFAMLGWRTDPFTLGLLLPVGISFYVFQSLSYTIDVYRREIPPCDNVVTFATYVTFFPQLVAGPIERSGSLMPQIAEARKFVTSQQLAGLALIVQGFFKKMVVADNLGFVVDFVFDSGAQPNGWLTVLGTYAFAFQIYADFSGYSDIAKGVARCFGIELMDNFSAPYLARSPREFWRRWHISLSTWLRDYLYIPLGGSRGGTMRRNRNLFSTMLLGGLWHGASWTFVIWGAFHGALLAIQHLLESAWHAIRPQRAIVSERQWVIPLLGMVVTFHLVCLGWLAFRASSLGQLGALLGSLSGPWEIGEQVLYMARYFLHFAWFAMVIQVVRHFAGRTPAESRNPVFTVVVCAYMLFHVWSEGVFEHGAQFIYFQF